MLKETHGFTAPEIATIIDNTEAMVKYYLHTARARMTEIFDLVEWEIQPKTKLVKPKKIRFFEGIF